MILNIKAALKSKLAVYLSFYQEAKKTKDLKRMILLGPIMSDLRDEIGILED